MRKVESKKVKVGVVSFSGGQDSTTVLTYVKNLGYELYALSFMYGQTLSREVEQARKICDVLGIKHLVFDIRVFREVACFSSITSPKKMSVPQYESYEEVKGRLPPFMYVPLRNSLFLVLCGAYLESILLRKIELEHIEPRSIEAKVFIGSTGGSSYPDNQPDFLKKAEGFLNAGSKVWTTYGVRMNVEAPLINMSKKEVVELAVRLKSPLHLTHTCYLGEEEACGRCPSCLARIEAFREAGYIDPIKYKVSIDWKGCKPIPYLSETGGREEDEGC